jgi:hypothetical protein
MLPSDYPYEKRVLSLLSQEIAGFYDPKHEKLFLSNKVPTTDLEEVLVHELTHALQDQEFHIPKDPFRDNEDQLLAYNALLEGEAMSVMFQQAIEKQKIASDNRPALLKLFSQELEHQSLQTKEDIPLFLKRTLLFPYVEGLKFVEEVKKKEGWKSVNELHQKKPASSEQILHPEKYPGEIPIEIAKSDETIPSAKLLSSNIMGEFGVQVIFQSRGDSKFEAIAEGWRGDRYWLFKLKDGHYSFIWKILWASEKDVEEFARAWESAYGEKAEKKGLETKVEITS